MVWPKDFDISQYVAAAVLCGAVWVIGAEILVLYGTFGSGLGAYGALGGVLVIMLWMNVVSQMLFFGAELCKVSASRNTRRS